MPTFRIEILTSQDRTAFSCGTEPLDRYFGEQVTQDIRRRVATCFVAIDEADGHLAGYYTLSAGAVVLTALPESLIKKLPRYPSVPVARLGRLAVDRDYRGVKLGAALLWDVYDRARRSELATYALVVDAKNDDAESFYSHHGFIRFGNVPHQLFLPFGKALNT